VAKRLAVCLSLSLRRVVVISAMAHESATGYVRKGLGTHQNVLILSHMQVRRYGTGIVLEGVSGVG
jgi:hypothetical protein